jgi:hypothetical protein
MPQCLTRIVEVFQYVEEQDDVEAAPWLEPLVERQDVNPVAPRRVRRHECSFRFHSFDLAELREPCEEQAVTRADVEYPLPSP